MPISWEHVDFFKPEEFDDPDHKGSGEEINGELLILLDRLRRETGWPIITHAIVGGCVDVSGTHGHSKRSYHLLEKGAKAVDFHFKTDKSPREQFYAIIRGGFTGIGVYYDWHWNNHPLSVGFHVDIRPKYSTQIWKREKGQYIYFLA